MIKYAFLGIVQGLTEFFPVSSKGHLVFLQHALHMQGEEIVLPVVLHLGTLAAVIVFLRRELKQLFSDRQLLVLVLVPTLITALIGVAGKKFFEGLFLRPGVVAPGMIFTGLVLLFTRSRTASVTSRERIGLRDSVWAGLAQSLAIIPGISRSGMTISSLLLRKADKASAFTFSFLISVPAVLGASLLEFKDIRQAAHVDAFNLLIGFVFSLVSGIAALFLLKRMLARDKFHYFGYYCLAMGIVLSLMAF